MSDDLRLPDDQRLRDLWTEYEMARAGRDKRGVPVSGMTVRDLADGLSRLALEAKMLSDRIMEGR